jgi:hypothetical protein
MSKKKVPTRDRRDRGNVIRDHGGYGRAAVAATKATVEKKKDPKAAWAEACKKQFPNSESSREKSCPRLAFLGLCYNGYLVGIPKDNKKTQNLGVNARYAIKAVRLLRNNPELAESSHRDLWCRVMRKMGKNLHHNQQMHVVLALWDSGMIRH